MLIINEIGNRYGNLIVVGRGENDQRGEASWICQCGCGNIISVLGSFLRNGRQKSCGCKKRLPQGEAAWNFLYRNLKRHAHERGYLWNITRQQLEELCQKSCFYCGAEPYQEIKDHYNHFNGGIKYNGLDRIDSDKDYTLENVVPCCGTCNYAKRVLSQEEFKSWVVRIYQNWASK